MVQGLLLRLKQVQADTLGVGGGRPIGLRESILQGPPQAEPRSMETGLDGGLLEAEDAGNLLHGKSGDLAQHQGEAKLRG